ncbi:MAG TPA: hypothetical protein VFE91_02270 [Nitrososphaerales archaeon]|nr:hypothetical protein [Nitrososphaerales archaeon]
MVNTRVVIVLGAAFAYFSIGAVWLAFDSGGQIFSYNWIDVVGNTGSAYGPCHCPVFPDPAETSFWDAVLPSLIVPGPLSYSLLVSPVALLLSAASLFRWRLMAYAGLASLTSGVIWLVGLQFLNLGQQASTLYIFPDQILLGPYIEITAGAILLGGYFLSLRDVLEWPKD